MARPMASTAARSHDGLAALAEGAAVGQGPPDLLLERQEEAGRQDERREPQPG